MREINEKEIQSDINYNVKLLLGYINELKNENEALKVENEKLKNGGMENENINSTN